MILGEPVFDECASAGAAILRSGMGCSLIAATQLYVNHSGALAGPADLSWRKRRQSENRVS
jgi:hypothetical protein